MCVCVCVCVCIFQRLILAMYYIRQMKLVTIVFDRKQTSHMQKLHVVPLLLKTGKITFSDQCFMYVGVTENQRSCKCNLVEEL